MTGIFFDVLELNLGITVVILILGLLCGKLRKRYGAGCMKWIMTFVAVLFTTSFVSCGYMPEETGEMILPSSSTEAGNEPAQEDIDHTQNQEDLTSLGTVIDPEREDVLAAREKALEGMSDEEIARLRENIKTANLAMERAYLDDNLFEKLSKKDNPYWQYFDQKGEIQLGWWYNHGIFPKESIMYVEGITEEEFAERYTEPGIVYNRFDADNFIALIADMQASVRNEELKTDLQQLIDLTRLAKLTHEMEYANAIYKILHDMDYFLLRYGIDDVLPFVKNGSTIAKYYGVLCIYGAEPFLLDPQKAAYAEILWNAYYLGIVEDKQVASPSMEGGKCGSFAIVDIDGDGSEELLFECQGGCTATTAEYIFDYRDGKVRKELSQWTDMTFYSNGIIEVGWTYNRTLADNEHWPYDVYQYNGEKDVYEKIGGVVAWNRKLGEVNKDGCRFPEEIDKDGDGIVYYLLPTDWDWHYDFEPVDREEYDAWRTNYLGDAVEKTDIPFLEMTEENLLKLGIPKPYFKFEEPAG
ncbi:MAG: hypothetical protein ACI4FY_11795 [Acetatifactor sp.]